MTGQSDSLYEHLPFNNAKRQIRLLQLDPSSPNGPLSGTMEVYDLDDNPVYEAFSYTWGPTTKDGWILVNDDFRLQITDNLYAALKRFAVHTHNKPIWIDALCINQKDDLEKGQQITMMGTIYTSAASVSIWLGDTGTTGRDSVEKFKYTVNTNPGATRSDRRGEWRDQIRQSKENKEETIRIVQEMQLLTMEKVLREAATTWSERAWILQEYALARSINICFADTKYCFETVMQANEGQQLATARAEAARMGKVYTGAGDSALSVNFAQDLETDVLRASPSRILRFLSRGGYQGSDFELVRNFFKRMDEIHLRLVRPRINLQAPPGLETAIPVVYYAEATDPRDKIYSLLGLIPQQDAEDIGRSYGIDCPKVYEKATRYCILKQNSFEPLVRFVDLRETRLPGLPSWAIDLSGQWLHRDSYYSPGDDRDLWKNEPRLVDRYPPGILARLNIAVSSVHSEDVASFSAGSTTMRIAGMKVGVVSRSMMNPVKRADIPKQESSYWSYHGIELCELMKAMSSEQSVQAMFTSSDKELRKRMQKTPRSGDKTWSWSRMQFRPPPDDALTDSRGDHRRGVSSFLTYCDLVVPHSYPTSAALFATDAGCVGMVPATTCVGDIIVMANGWQVPFVLRPAAQGYVFRGFGSVYDRRRDDLEWPHERELDSDWGTETFEII